ncbi:MAG: DUF4148 domain-containing protein [Burkholderiales bacterium]
MTTHLHRKPWATLGVIAIAAASASTVFAADVPARTRAEVNAETLAARAAGTLVPAGENIDTRGPLIDSHSALTRADVMADVLAARASGRLLAAGEATEPATSNVATAPVLARAAVKADVLAARAAGDLVPAGEGPVPEAQQRSRAAAAWMAKAHPRRPATLETASASQ